MAPHVLVVDPDTSAAQITNALAQHVSPSAVVDCVRTAELGWSQARHVQPDILIIDPGASGTEGRRPIELCRQAFPAVAIIVLASAPTPALRAHVAHLQVEVYIEKPVTPAALIDQLRRILEPAKPAPLVTTQPSAASP